MIEVALLTDAARLTQIMRQSKAYWGYSEDQLKLWESVLLVTETHLIDYIVFKLIVEEEIVGFYSLLPKGEKQVWLENLFIVPSIIGNGQGSCLLQHAIDESKKRGFQEMKLEADPNAEYFYLKRGFKVIGQQPTSIPGRFMPIMTRFI